MDGTRRTPSRRDFLKLVGTTGAVALLAACGSDGAPAAPAAGGGAAAPAADTAATLTIFDFGGDADKQIYADAHARFKQKFPNVTINDNFTPVTTWSEYSNKITTQVAGGQSPDIINIAIEGARLLVSKGLLQPLDEFLAGDAAVKELTDDVAPALIEPFKIDGKTWYIPHSWNNMVIYYNTKMFKDAGIEPPKPDWTWDDFLGIAKKLTTGSGADQVFGFGVPNFNFGLQPWLLTNGTTQLNADWSDSNLNDPKVLEAITFVHDLVHVHKVAPAVEGTDTANLFAAGKLAMSGWGHWPIQGFLANNFRDFDVQYWPRKAAQTHVFGVGGSGRLEGEQERRAGLGADQRADQQGDHSGLGRGGRGDPGPPLGGRGRGVPQVPAQLEDLLRHAEGHQAGAQPGQLQRSRDDLSAPHGRHHERRRHPQAGMQAAHDELSTAMA